ncbi:MAG: hypothetical protein D6689_17275 [Deltaproteobacteria bacterium]|nr:MAG: hypothetical protein D6689_17275 [Deltaproteobacteria bacterium]
MATRIFVRKDTFKFSCAHMTVFPDGSKERLHGHNYFVSVALDLADASLDQLIDFGSLKAAIAALCGEWKERLLLAAHNPHFELLRDSGNEIEFRLCGQRYVLPAADVLLLPTDNTTVERLAECFCERLLAAAAPGWPAGAVTAVEVTVTESPGQGATVRQSPIGAP